MLLKVTDGILKNSGIRYFTANEFRCKCFMQLPAGQGCGGDTKMDMAFIKLLDEFRDFCGFAFRITSAYRCPDHPIEAKKEHPGPHQTGQAVDIAVWGHSAYDLKMALGKFVPSEPRLGFFGVGENQKGNIDSRFIHLDMCENTPYRPRPHCWTY